MPTARIASIGGPVDLYYEETGQGFPLIWCHEYGGDYRSWEQQIRFFSRRYRVVTWNYRGYPPSEVPKEGGAYRSRSSWTISAGSWSTWASGARTSAGCRSAAA